MDTFKDKVVLVTGATGGMGRSIVSVFASRGAAVAVADLPDRKEQGDVLAASLAGEALAVALDVRQPGTISAAVDETVNTLGGLDIMVCNAGLNVRGPALEVTEEGWDTVLDVNLKGVFFSAQAAARQMVRQGRGGKVVNIASIMGLVASARSSAAYCASKAGVVNLTRALAIEWAEHDIQVNAVGPTYVRTPLTEPLFSDPALLEAVLERTPNHRLATTEDIAEAVAFLASPAANMITGVTLPVDGGWTAW
jgi:NAD(P)-dependent dehydrogenase (short-subunit alcohol dehydrogenase family)